jgi:hypothetical protein
LQRIALALLLVLGGCLTGFAQNSKPSPITKEVLGLRLAALQRDRTQAVANVNAYDGAIQECQFWLELLKDAEQEEAMIEFPKWKYHKNRKAQLVKNAEEEEALGPGWADSPAAFQTKKPAPAEPEYSAPKPEPEGEPDALELGAALRAREKAIESKGKKKPK